MSGEKIDWTKPLELTDGRKVRVLATDLASDALPVVIVIKDRSGYEWSSQVTSDGQWSTEYADAAVRNVPEKGVRYVNVYEGRSGSAFCTRADADACVCDDRIACVRVEYQVGQFDE